MNSEIISKQEKLKQIKSKIDLKNIKSDYFFIKIFDIMEKIKTFKIMKYNKELQKRLNITINDYQKCSQLYSSIEIELKLDNNMYSEQNKFINISEEEKQFYHIYFDNSKEEIKSNYLKGKEKVNTIKVIIDHKVKSFKKLFYDCDYVSCIFLKNFIELI